MNISQLQYCLQHWSLFEIFGKDIKNAYRSYARIVHPDVAGNGDVFALLAEKHAEAVNLIASGTYPSDVDFQITASGNTYNFTRNFREGDISDIYSGFRDRDGGAVLAKVASSLDCNEFFMREEKSLIDLNKKKEETLQGENGFNITLFPPAPTLAISQEVRIHIFPNYCVGDRRYFSLKEIVELFGNKLEGRHLVWVFNRILLALIVANSCGIVHGAISPEHILINPQTHDVLLIGWGFSTPIGSNIPVKSESFADFYPSNWDLPANSGLDIYMAAKCMFYAMDKNNTPKTISDFFSSCVIENPNFRLDNPLDVYNNFLTIQRSTYGERRFVKLQLNQLE